MKNLIIPVLRCKIVFFGALFLLLTFSSCDKTEVPSISSDCCLVDKSLDEVIVNSKGKLQFSTTKAWQGMMEAITDNNIDKVLKYLKEKKHFTPQYSYKYGLAEEPTTDAVVKMEGTKPDAADSVRYSYLVDRKLALLTNRNHQLQIGDTVLHFQNDYIFIYLPKDSIYVDAFYKDLKSNAISVVDDKPFLYKSMIVSKTNVTIYKQESESGRIQGTVTNYFDGEYRVYGNVYTVNNHFYSSAGIETMIQHKESKCSGWWLWRSCSDSWDPIDVPYGNVGLGYDLYVFLDAVNMGRQTGQVLGDKYANKFIGEQYGVTNTSSWWWWWHSIAGRAKQYELLGGTYHGGRLDGIVLRQPHTFGRFNAYTSTLPFSASCPL